MRKITIKWLKQAEADLKAAKDSLNDENYEWSCFQSQQSGEKALKAVFMREDIPLSSHIH
jgi:HEPN domain-containing protein